MVRYLSLIAVVALAGCSSVSREYELPRTPVAVENRPLVVPHRDWIAEHCWPVRTQLADGRWVDQKHCEIPVYH